MTALRKLQSPFHVRFVQPPVLRSSIKGVSLQSIPPMFRSLTSGQELNQHPCTEYYLPRRERHRIWVSSAICEFGLWSFLQNFIISSILLQTDIVENVFMEDLTVWCSQLPLSERISLVLDDAYQCVRTAEHAERGELITRY